MTETQTLLNACVAGIQEKKGKNIRIVDLEGIDDTITNTAEGNTPTQVAAITESVRDFARKEAQTKPSAVDGTRNNLWVALDFIDIVVHIFVPDAREFYDIDHLWEDAKMTDIPNLD